jgi:hypothetical protein
MIDQIIDKRIEILKNLYRISLYNTCKKLLGYPDINKHTHGDMIDCLKSYSRRKLIVMPRGTLKSTVCSVGYPIWQLIRDPDIRILLDSELYSNSSKFLREIKGHLQSRSLIELFGEFYNPSNWNEGEITILQRTKNLKESSITCSGIGAQKTGQHYDLIIADDLNSKDNSYTEELREKVVEHYKYYISLLEPDGTLIVVGTRYAYGDVIGHILSEEIEPRGLLNERS